MLDDCKDVVRGCAECNVFNEEKISKASYPVLLGEYFDRISFDLVGPMKETNKENKYIIVCIEY